MVQIRRLLLALGITLVLAGCSGSLLGPDVPTSAQDDENPRSVPTMGSG